MFHNEAWDAVMLIFGILENYICFADQNAQHCI